MAAWKLIVFLCVPAALGLGLSAALVRGWIQAKKPLSFAQATVVDTGPGDRATFRLFDGQTITLTAPPGLLATLHQGDYGRLSYYSDSRRLLSWQRTNHI